jgi:TolB-like protein/Tfp pilus assembly protein PilF
MMMGRFELVRELGRGGFGVVYEARDRELGRLVALKVVATGGLGGTREDRLVREAEVAAQLSHPNIVTLHDVGRGAHGPYLVLELLRGETLAERLGRGRLSVREALRVAVAVARGLAHAHAAGVVHRDLTPGNVFLCEDGQVKVLDLGLAHAFGARKIEGGTAAYMAPEQERGAPEDERTDVYALGAILYRALTGDSPSARAGSTSGELRPPRLDVPDLPALADLLATMMAPDPVRRPRDSGVVLAALEKLERELSRLDPEHSPAVRRWSSKPAECSVAVLPFADLSPARDQEWLCDGIAEEIIHALGGLRGLRVASRSASFHLRGSGGDVGAMAAAVGVTTLLEGSVRRAGRRVRITARLVGEDGYEAWSEIFDRMLEDVFAVQCEIAQAVAGALQVRLSSGEARRLQRVGTRNARAYEAYLKARQLRPLSCTRFERTRQLLQEAIELDGVFAEAHAALADADFFVLQWHNAPGDPKRLQAEALAASDTALRLDPTLAEAHVARANLLALAHRNTEAEEEYRTANALNPGLAEAAWYYARFLLASGRIAEAAEAGEEAARRDPENYGPPTLLAQVYRSLGDAPRQRAAMERAHDVAEQWLRLNPGDAIATTLLGHYALEVGEVARGHLLLARALELEPENLGVQYNVACAYAKTGDHDRALDLLERALTEGRGFRGWIENDSDLDALRNRPRFKAILDRLPASALVQRSGPSPDPLPRSTY